MSGRRATLVRGALAGYAASRTMDAVTTAFLARQSPQSRAREEELAAGGTLVVVGRGLGRALGRELDAARAARAGVALHRGLGVAYGMVAAALVRRGRPPMTAGPLVAAVAWAVVDEGTSLPTMTAYPLVSHLRGVVGHATHGLVTGALLAAMRG